jgi:type II secretory pathway pseudopilin PulG
LVIATLIVLVLVAVGIPVFSGLRDDAAKERARAAQRQEALEAAERARLTRDARPVRARGPRPGADADPLAHRAVLVDRAQAKILADARGRVAAGTLDGTIRGVSCSPFPQTQERIAAEETPGVHAARYDCVAYTSKFTAPEGRNGQPRTGLFGYPYWLVIDYDDSAFVWCKVTPRAGEGGRSLAFVPVPEPCRDPAGPG